MKRNVLSVALLLTLFAITTQAQIHKGAIFLGGNVGGNSQKTTSANNTTGKQNGITVSPVFGKATKENMVWGVSAVFGVSNYFNSNSYPSKQDFDLYGAGIFARKYKPLGNSNFYLFLQGGLGLNYSRSEYEYNTVPQSNLTKRYSIGVSAYPGLSYGVSKKFQLETGFNNLVSMSYFTEKNYITGASAGTSKTRGFNVSTSLDNLSSLYVGFRVLLN